MRNLPLSLVVLLTLLGAPALAHAQGVGVAITQTFASACFEHLTGRGQGWDRLRAIGVNLSRGGNASVRVDLGDVNAQVFFDMEDAQCRLRIRSDNMRTDRALLAAEHDAFHAALTALASRHEERGTNHLYARDEVEVFTTVLIGREGRLPRLRGSVTYQLRVGRP